MTATGLVGHSKDHTKWRNEKRQRADPVAQEMSAPDLIGDIKDQTKQKHDC